MGQDQVSGGVSVLCWLAAPVAMFYGNLQNSVLRSKSVFKSSSVTLDQHSRIATDFDNMNEELFFYGLFIIKTLFSKLF